MKPISLTAYLAIGATYAVALPTVTDGPDAPPDLLSIVSLFDEGKCTGSSWTISTGTWSNLDGGCSPINATWSMQSAKIGYLGDACQGEIADLRSNSETVCPLSFSANGYMNGKVTLYTDASCSDNAVTPVLDTCATSSGPVWKSYLISGCSVVEE